jgi:hypothetical protein
MNAMEQPLEREQRTDANADDRIVHLEQLIGSLMGRLTILELSARAGAPRRGDAEMHPRGGPLRGVIRRLLEQYPGPRRGAAKRIYPHILETEVGRERRPTLRTVQHHITQTRKDPALHVRR